MSESTDSKPKAEIDHRCLGIDLFNVTWKLMTKPDRSPDDVDTMIHTAHASRYHWGCAPEHGSMEIAIGEWQLSRVYALLARPEACLWHAERCLAICTEASLTDWLLAFAHESMARAYAAEGKKSEFEKHYELASTLSEKIKDKDDKALLLSDLKLGPWYGFVDESGATDIRIDE